MAEKKRYRNIAVLLAGGSGQRMGGKQPKQMMKLGGKTVLEHSMLAFQQNENIDEIMLVCHADIMDDVRRLTQKGAFNKVRRIIEGGAERMHSTLNALRALQEFGNEKAGQVNMILHDAARPLLSQRIITDVCLALQEHHAVAVAVPCTDTIFQTQGDRLKAIPPRDGLMAAQTPQAFRLSVLRRAYEAVQQDASFRATDDCGVVMKYLPEVAIHIVTGDSNNRKLTFQNDLAMLEAILSH